MRMEGHIKRLIEKNTIEAFRCSGDEAVEKFQQAYSHAKELGNAFTVRACASNLGAMLIKLGTKEKAQKGLKLLERSFPPKGESDCVSNGDLFFNIALGYEVRELFEKAYQNMTKAKEEYCNERDNQAMVIKALKKLIKLSQDRHKVEDAIKWCRELEEVYAKANQLVDHFRTLLQRASFERQLGVEDTEEHNIVKECEEQLEKIRKKNELKVTTLVEMSVMLAQMKKFEDARKYLQEANGMHTVDDELSLERAVVLQNLGTVCNYLDDWQSAVIHHTSAAAIYHHHASLPPNPASRIQPFTARKCEGHVMANHAYAMVKLDDLDEACKLFDRALDLAKQTDDVDTVWQIEEALGAVNCRLALRDINLPSPRQENLKLFLTESRLRYLDKSLKWFKSALRHVATAPGGSTEVHDRVLDKCSMLTTFKSNAKRCAPEQMGLQEDIHTEDPFTMLRTQPIITFKGRDSNNDDDDDGDEDDKGGDAKGSDDSDSDESGEEEETSSEDDSGGPSAKMGRTCPQPPDEEEEDEKAVKELYEKQLDEGTYTRHGGGDVGRAGPLQAAARDNDDDHDDDDHDDEEDTAVKQAVPTRDSKQTVKVDVHRHVSSSAESGSSTDDDDDDDEEDSDDDEEDSDDDEEDSESEEEEGDGEEERKGRRGLPPPPLPTQSPPPTLQASGTYENPQPLTEEQISQLYPAPRQGPQQQGSTNYAQLDFDGKRQRQQPQPRSGHSKGQGTNPDYESMEIRSSSPPARTTDSRSRQSESPIDFDMGGEALDHEDEGKQKKDSKTCAVM